MAKGKKRGKGDNSNAQLRGIVERVERLAEEKAALTADIREIYEEAKGDGFDPKIIRKVVAIRRRDKEELAEEEAQIDLYFDAIHK